MNTDLCRCTAIFKEFMSILKPLSLCYEQSSLEWWGMCGIKLTDYMGMAIHLPKPNIPEANIPKANFLKAMIFVRGSGASALLHNLYGVPTCPVCETWLSTCRSCNSCRHCWGCGENGSLL